jgi:hypothetical protein
LSCELEGKIANKTNLALAAINSIHSAAASHVWTLSTAAAAADDNNDNNHL